jgi:hypothetical protein
MPGLPRTVRLSHHAVVERMVAVGGFLRCLYCVDVCHGCYNAEIGSFDGLGRKGGEVVELPKVVNHGHEDADGSHVVQR